MDQKNSHSFLL